MRVRHPQKLGLVCWSLFTDSGWGLQDCPHDGSTSPLEDKSQLGHAEQLIWMKPEAGLVYFKIEVFKRISKYGNMYLFTTGLLAAASRVSKRMRGPNKFSCNQKCSSHKLHLRRLHLVKERLFFHWEDEEMLEKAFQQAVKSLSKRF